MGTVASTADMRRLNGHNSNHGHRVPMMVKFVLHNPNGKTNPLSRVNFNPPRPSQQNNRRENVIYPVVNFGRPTNNENPNSNEERIAMNSRDGVPLQGLSFGDSALAGGGQNRFRYHGYHSANINRSGKPVKKQFNAVMNRDEIEV